MINGSLAMVMNIVLNITLIRFWGHSGLALATSISSLICIALLFNSLNKKIGYFGQDKIICTMLKSLISSIFMGIITVIAYRVLANILGIGFIQDVISLFISVGIGVIVYAGLIIRFKVEEVNILINMIKCKYKKIESEVESI